VFDVILGVLYALVGCWASLRLYERWQRRAPHPNALTAVRSRLAAAASCLRPGNAA
jgi:hypothetical protein